MSRFGRLAVFAVALFSFAPLASASVITYQAFLSGLAETPSNASPGTGLATLAYDSASHMLAVSASWNDLIGSTTVAHVHCCISAPGNVGVAVTPGTLPGFPPGVVAGTYTAPLDLTLATTFTASFVTTFAGGSVAAAEGALLAGLGSGQAYFNIHTTAFPGGEIRGFLVRVPEPTTLVLLASGLVGVVRSRRRDR